MIRYILFFVWVIVCFGILFAFLHFAALPKKDTKTYEIRRSVLQLFVSLPLAAGVLFLLIHLNRLESGASGWFLYWVNGILVFLAGVGIWGILDFLNYRVWYDEEKIIRRNASGWRKVFYFEEIVGVSRQPWTTTVVFHKGKICLNEMCRGQEKFLFYAVKQYKADHDGETLPEVETVNSEEFGIIAFVCAFFLLFAISYLMPASKMTAAEFTGTITNVYQDLVSGNDVVFQMSGIHKSFRVTNGADAIDDFAKMKSESHHGMKFSIDAEEIGNDEDSYYKVWQIEDKNGKRYLTYNESNRQEWKADFKRKLVMAGLGILVITVFLLASLAYAMPKRFIRLRCFFFRS